MTPKLNKFFVCVGVAGSLFLTAPAEAARYACSMSINDIFNKKPITESTAPKPTIQDGGRSSTNVSVAEYNQNLSKEQNFLKKKKRTKLQKNSRCQDVKKNSKERDSLAYMRSLKGEKLACFCTNNTAPSSPLPPARPRDLTSGAPVSATEAAPLQVETTGEGALKRCANVDEYGRCF